MKNRGAFALHGRSPKSFARDLTVRFKLHDGHVQHFRAVLKSVFRSRFRRQVIRKVVRQAQEVLQRVVVFIASQAAERRMSPGCPAHRGRKLEFAGKPRDHCAAIGVRQFDFVRRRHLAIAQDCEDLEPPVDVFSLQQVGIQSIDPDVAFLSLRTVTFHTGPSQDGLDGLFEIGEIGPGNLSINRRRKRLKELRAFRSCDFQFLK